MGAYVNSQGAKLIASICDVFFSYCIFCKHTMFYIMGIYFFSPFCFSVLFKLGESVHLTSSLPGNQSTFYHLLTSVTMTTPNSSRQRAHWWVSRQTHRSDDGGQDGANEKCGQRRKKKGFTFRGTRMINEDCTKTVFSSPYRLSQKEQKHTKELWGTFVNTDWSWKHDREPSTVVCAWTESVLTCTWADCVTIRITFIDLLYAFLTGALKESSILFIGTLCWWCLSEFIL